jgi:hypothetical protein
MTQTRWWQWSSRSADAGIARAALEACEIRTSLFGHGAKAFIVDDRNGFGTGRRRGSPR